MNAPFRERASQLSVVVYAPGDTHQPSNRKGKQNQFSSSSLFQRVSRAQNLPMSESAGSRSKQFAYKVHGTSGLTNTQKRNLRRRLKRASAKANLSNVTEITGSGIQRPLSSNSTSSPCLKVLQKASSPCLKVLQKEPRKDLHPGPFAANKTIKMAIVREDFPTNKLSAENSALIQRAILQQMDSALSDNLSLKIYSTSLRKGALIVHCGDVATGNWIRNHLDGDREILGGEALLVYNTSSKKLPKRKLCKVAFKVRTTFETDSSILLRRLQRLNEGLITEHWRVLHTTSDPNSSRWIFEVEESDVDTIRGFNLRAFSGLNYGVFKILFDPREKKKCKKNKSPEDNFSEETAFRGPVSPSSNPELEDMYLVCSDSEEAQPSIPGLTLLYGDD